jgi:hypothetical protein
MNHYVYLCPNRQHCSRFAILSGVKGKYKARLKDMGEVMFEADKTLNRRVPEIRNTHIAQGRGEGCGAQENRRGLVLITGFLPGMRRGVLERGLLVRAHVTGIGAPVEHFIGALGLSPLYIVYLKS